MHSSNLKSINVAQKMRAQMETKKTKDGKDFAKQLRVSIYFALIK